MGSLLQIWPLAKETTKPRFFWGGRIRLLFLGAGLLAYFLFAPAWPTEQHLRIKLGDGRDVIEEVRVRCASGAGDSNADWAREVTFRYAKGQAPRIVGYEPRLASGDYLVEIEQTTSDGHVRTTDRRVRLEGGTTTSIDVSEDLSRPPGRAD
jgi:hypothetical protein